MKMQAWMAAAAAALLAGCATVTPPAGMVPGKFVSFDCPGGQDFQARFNPDGNTVRVRSHSGAAELSAQGENYAGDGFTLTLKGAEGISLSFGGKTLGRNCKRQ
jgi:hypothetical protein